jgi:hypothetical protein
MLKIELNIFENEYIWEKKRHITLFKNKQHLNYYQNFFLKNLIKKKILKTANQ